MACLFVGILVFLCYNVLIYEIIYVAFQEIAVKFILKTHHAQGFKVQ